MKLADVFTDGAVFQRNMSIPVWGTAKPRTKIRAEFAGKKMISYSTLDGSFTIYLPSVEAGGPYELTVKSEAGEEVVLKNILVGEVWVAGGQSNMQYALNSDWVTWTAQTFTAEERENLLSRKQEREFYNSLKNPDMFRGITVPLNSYGVRTSGFEGKWLPMTPENAGPMSAVAAWFAKMLMEKLNIPVGILNVSYGGTSVETWTSRAGLMRNPETASQVAKTDEKYAQENAWKNMAFNREDYLNAITRKDPGNEGFGKGWANPDFDDSGWTVFEVPGIWTSSNIAGNGSCWFRRSVTIPEHWAGRELLLETGGMDKQDITYFNGVEIGRTGKDFEEDCWNKPRQYPIPANLVKAGKAVLAIRIYSFIYDGGFNGKREQFFLKLKGTEETLPVCGDWMAHSELDLGPIAIVPPDFTPDNPNTPSNLYNTMLAPVIPYGIRGAIWYQGEHHTDSIPDAQTYAEKLRNMIESWRYSWGQGNFPFIQVQLANYTAPKSYDGASTWPIIREQQLEVTKTLANVGMISAIDIGEAEDIHPLDKKSVGARLAACALNQVYHVSTVAPNGPVVRSSEPERNSIRVNFECADGLNFKGGEPKGFFIAGFDRKFVPADSVKIEGSSIVVSAKAVEHPFSVRYSWSNNPDGNLYNSAGFPASSFRTDSWDLLS